MTTQKVRISFYIDGIHVLNAKRKVAAYKSTFLACPNSDGLLNFKWSHDGYWELGGLLVMKNDTIAECVEACTANDKCLAFSYSLLVNRKTYCYHFHDKDYLNDEKIIYADPNENIKAYIRCQGTESYITSPTIDISRFNITRYRKTISLYHVYF